MTAVPKLAYRFVLIIGIANFTLRRSCAFWLRRLEISWKRCEAIAKGSTQFGSMINGESVLSGGKAIATMWKSLTITSGRKR
jgi:hypothetical protein